MDIIDPFSRSRSGKRFVLVVCDYGTQFPEAIPMKFLDVEHVVEVLLALFSRFGVPKKSLLIRVPTSLPSY
jgi:hypothetical protein